MKSRLFTILAVVAVLVVLANLIPTSAAFASVDREYKFSGVIQSLPANGSLIGDWNVSGRTVHVSAATHIDQSEGPVAKGRRVQIDGLKQKGGSITALSIDTLSPHPSGQ